MKKISLMLAIAGFISTATFAQEAKAKKAQPATRTEPAEKPQQVQKAQPVMRTDPAPQAERTQPEVRNEEPVNTAPATIVTTTKPQTIKRIRPVQKATIQTAPVEKTVAPATEK